jgi:hypothetical protein
MVIEDKWKWICCNSTPIIEWISLPTDKGLNIKLQWFNQQWTVCRWACLAGGRMNRLLHTYCFHSIHREQLILTDYILIIKGKNKVTLFLIRQHVLKISRECRSVDQIAAGLRQHSRSLLQISLGSMTKILFACLRVGPLFSRGEGTVFLRRRYFCWDHSIPVQ